MKKYLFAALAFANIFLACGRLPKIGPPAESKLATASESDCGFVQNSFGQRVSWKQSLPVKVYIDPSFPSEYDKVLIAAGKRWDEVLGRTLFLFERAGQTSSPAKDNRNVLYWMNPWSGVDQKLQGVSSLSWRNNQLIEADIKVDAQYYSFFVTAPASTRDIHLESLLVHELGHVLGLKHMARKTSSVMLEVLDFLMVRETPTSEDQANLKCEYN